MICNESTTSHNKASQIISGQNYAAVTLVYVLAKKALLVLFLLNALVTSRMKPVDEKTESTRIKVNPIFNFMCYNKQRLEPVDQR